MAFFIREKSVKLLTFVGIWILRIFIFMFDVLTFPLYFVYQRSWRKIILACETRASIIKRTPESITFKPVEQMSPILEKFIHKNIKTMDECFDSAVEQHSHKSMLGTRKILSEEEEIQTCGKVLTKWVMGEYKWKSYSEVNEMAIHFGRGLRELGLNPRNKICIFADTKEEWMISAQGCFKQNLAIVTLYANLGDDGIVYGINQTKVTHVITTHDLLPKFKKILPKTPGVIGLIFIEDQIKHTIITGYKPGVSIKSFSKVIELGCTSKFRCENPCEEDTAIIMYTSGSTGTPKGVVLPHRALIACIQGFILCAGPPKFNDIYLGYLPIAHILELLLEILWVWLGVPIGYSSPTTMIDTSTKIKKGGKGDCSVLRPTLMSAVPMVIERLYNGFIINIAKQGYFMETFLCFCYKYKSFYRKVGMTTPIMDALIYKKMRAVVGGKVRRIWSGGASLSPDIHDYVRCALSIPIQNGYGLTETCALATAMDEHDHSSGRAGAPFRGVLIKLINWEEGNYKISDDPPRGEVVISGNNLATEYFKLPEETKQSFITDQLGNTWFLTGDIGEMAPNGTLKIIDRKKDLVKLIHGEYIALGKIESELKTSNFVESMCIYGDALESYCVALIVPNKAKLTTLAETLGLEHKAFEDLCSDKQLNYVIQKELQDLGNILGLNKFEIPGAITLVTEEWTPESGLVTSTSKLKRKIIQDFYQKEINSMYDK